MIIPIQLSPGGDQEYAIVELQGEVQVTGAAGSSSSDGLGGLPLGELSINPLGKPVLVIGGHKLIGKFVTLPKRLAVLEYKDRQEPQQPCGTPSKSHMVTPGNPDVTPGNPNITPGNPAGSVATPGSSGSGGGAGGGAGAGSDAMLADVNDVLAVAASASYQVKGFISRKIMFTQRPRPIVSTTGRLSTKRRRR